MSKRLRTRDKLLLGVAIFGDLFFEMVEPLSVQIKRMKGVLPPDYKNTNFTRTVSNLLKTGYIEKIVKEGKPYFRLSGVGRKYLVRDFPIFTLREKKWDRLWRMVLYDIPEKNRYQRKKLEGKLKELGFGMIQKSVYITPFDVAEDFRDFVIEQSLDDFVVISVSKKLFAGEIDTFVRRIWKLTQLEEEYYDLYHKILQGGAINSIFSEYEEILKKDPCLPSDLLPRDWIGDKVHQAIKSFPKL